MHRISSFAHIWRIVIPLLLLWQICCTAVIVIAEPYQREWWPACGGSSRWLWFHPTLPISPRFSLWKGWIRQLRARRISPNRQGSNTVPSKEEVLPLFSGWASLTGPRASMNPDTNSLTLKNTNLTKILLFYLSTFWVFISNSHLVLTNSSLL